MGFERSTNWFCIKSNEPPQSNPYLGLFEGEVLQHQDAFDLRVLDLLEKSLLVTEAQALGHVQVTVLHLAGQKLGHLESFRQDIRESF